MKKYKIAIVAGEESGDQLGADIIKSLEKKTGKKLEIIGVGGHNLEKLGLQSLFPSHEISLMGIKDILKNLKKLLSYLEKTSNFFINENPDCILLIDNQEFNYQIAKNVKKRAAHIPIIQYVAPSVWAWREKRAKKIKPYIDHLLAILPFEEEVMKQLDGPPTTYVGHRLVNYAPIQDVQNYRQNFIKNISSPTLLLLPGSRFFEINLLMPCFEKTVEHLKKNYPDLKIFLPTLEKTHSQIQKFIQKWKFKPKILTTENEKWEIFKKADFALAASGTVSLELALCGIPTVLSYKMDFISKIFIKPRIKIWSAALPNLISGKPLVPEFFNEFVNSEMLARQLQYLLENDHKYKAQLDGFSEVFKLMSCPTPPGDLGAEIMLNFLKSEKK